MDLRNANVYYDSQNTEKYFTLVIFVIQRLKHIPILSIVVDKEGVSDKRLQCYKVNKYFSFFEIYDRSTLMSDNVSIQLDIKPDIFNVETYFQIQLGFYYCDRYLPFIGISGINNCRTYSGLTYLNSPIQIFDNGIQDLVKKIEYYSEMFYINAEYAPGSEYLNAKTDFEKQKTVLNN